MSREKQVAIYKFVSGRCEAEASTGPGRKEGVRVSGFRWVSASLRCWASVSALGLMSRGQALNLEWADVEVYEAGQLPGRDMYIGRVWVCQATTAVDWAGTPAGQLVPWQTKPEAAPTTGSIPVGPALLTQRFHNASINICRIVRRLIAVRDEIIV